MSPSCRRCGPDSKVRRSTSTGDATSKDIGGTLHSRSTEQRSRSGDFPTVEGAHGDQEERECGEVAPPPCLIPK